MRSRSTISVASVILVLFALILLPTLIFADQERSLNRDDIDDKYKWDFSDIYPDWETWQADMVILEKKMDEYAALQGTLTKGSDEVLHAFKLSDDLGMLLYKVYRYPQLQRDVDTRDNEISAKMQEVQILLAKFGTATSWFNPELLSIGWDRMKSWLDKAVDLQPYRYTIEDLYRQQEHVLDEDKEKLLSYFSQLNSTPDQVYSELSTSDIKFPDVTLSDGDTVKMTAGRYYKTLSTNRNQADRKKAFEEYYSIFHANVNTYAAIYNSVLQSDWAMAQARNYSSTLEAALDADNIPVEVYESLITTVKANTAPIRKYVKLRKRMLGLDEYHLYDGSIPIVKFDKTYDYDDASKWVVEAMAPLGKDYQKKMKEGFRSRWIDVYENEGKSSGAYSAGVYGVHPFLLLNYNETIDNVFTVAHEMGHCMHTILSQENQPFATSDYTIFVAEVASTLNEALLLDYFLDRTKDPVERVVLLQNAIESILGTFYTQVMFADFEWQAHKLVEDGKPVTADALRGIYTGLLNEYYGDALVVDSLYGSTWTRISHFYGSPYYVFKYATCFASSAKIAKEIGSKDKKARQAALKSYLNLLKSGGNDYPMEQLKKAGVDLSQPETILAVVDQLNDLVTQLESELNKMQ